MRLAVVTPARVTVLAALGVLGLLGAGCGSAQPESARAVHDTLAAAMGGAMATIAQYAAIQVVTDETVPCTDMAHNDNGLKRVLITYRLPSPEADGDMAASLDRFRGWLAANGARDISDGRPELANVSGAVNAGTLTLNGAPRPPLRLTGSSACFLPG